MMTASEIRKAFLDFFASKGHQIVPSAPIVVKNDPTLMFTNAGMNQFKDIFLGEAPAKYKRVVDTQRCLRVSGKHNDLEEVGIDTYHHTMFEMLGNWSFGDYFKKEAIAWSWELLTDIYKIDKDRLYVTIFEGDEKEGLPKDQEAYDYWKQYVPEDHILLGNKKDNFWEMGETGPCGPCSEIHYDNRDEGERLKVKGERLVNQDDPQVIEIWNNVFMQFNRLKDGSLQPLPAKHVDTGMGFERLVRVLQGKSSNYDTDVFQGLINFLARDFHRSYGFRDSKADIAMRVIADHIRAVAFTIADGQLPSNTGAGYVVRRILRRAVRYGYSFLDARKPFFYELVDPLDMSLGEVFPVLRQQKEFIKRVIKEEEINFFKTLEDGLWKLTYFFQYGYSDKFPISKAEGYEALNKKVVPGKLAFNLYDTNGFPIDLIRLVAAENGFTVDDVGFNEGMQEQKARSRAATAIDTGDWVILKNEDGTEFTGYDETETIAHVVKYRKVTAKGKEQYQIVLDKTPFYAESGGQVGDTGQLVFPDGEIVQVTDTKKENALIVHFVEQLPTHKAMEDALTAIVDPERRHSIEGNHSATHLLHAALKQVLGSHVNQKGSLVNDEYLRFDFSHFAKVTEEELARIEAIVNEKVRENIGLKEERNVAYQVAITSGVTALFGEKYGEYVRVITFDDDFSKELCGGTHVQATGQIGYFKIISESAVAAGVRRIEAITGAGAENYINEQSKLIHQLKELLKNPKDIGKSIESLLEENSKLKKELEKAVLEKSSGLKDELAKKAQEIKGINFIAEKVELPNMDAVQNLAYQLRDIVPNMFLVLGTIIDGRPKLMIMLSDSLARDQGYSAGNIIRELAKEIQGGGGGQPFYATAGGKDAGGLDRALAKAKEYLN